MNKFDMLILASGKIFSHAYFRPKTFSLPFSWLVCLLLGHSLPVPKDLPRKQSNPLHWSYLPHHSHIHSPGALTLLCSSMIAHTPSNTLLNVFILFIAYYLSSHLQEYNLYEGKLLSILYTAKHWK